MIKKVVVPDMNINYKDIYHLKNLYKMVRDWVLAEGFGPDKYMEKLYFQKDTQTGGSEHQIWWTVEKIRNSYIKYRIDIYYHTLTMNKTDVVIKGQKMKVDKGELDLHLKGTMMYDYDNKWEKSKFMGFFHDFFRKRLMKDNFKKLEDEFIFDVYRLHAHVKQYLELKQMHPTDFPTESLGFPRKGI